jgi:hypothetical protein
MQSSTSLISWQETRRYVESSVFDSDFVDSDKNSYGGDLTNFDVQGNFAAIGYFSGHGVTDGGTTQACSHDSDCANPPSGTTLPAVCRSIPGAGLTCLYDTPRRLVTNGAVAHFGNLDDLGTGLVTFGESPESGGWDGAGTNGSLNLVVMDISFGVTPTMYDEQLGNAFAGLHLWATIMPTYGDTSDVADRGSKFATGYTMSPYVAVADAWISVVTNIGDGLPCNGNAAYGGYGGINGCGCNVIFNVTP